jgi:hypothetical protein
MCEINGKLSFYRKLLIILYHSVGGKKTVQESQKIR